MNLTTVNTPLTVCALLYGTPEFNVQESCNQSYFRIMSWSYQGTDHNVRALIQFPEFLNSEGIEIKNIYLTLRHWSNQSEKSQFYTAPVHGFGNHHYAAVSSVEINALSAAWPQGKLKNWLNQPPLKKKSIVLPPPKTSTSDFLKIPIESLGISAVVKHGVILKMHREQRYRGLIFAGPNSSTINDRPVATVVFTRLNGDWPEVDAVLSTAESITTGSAAMGTTSNNPATSSSTSMPPGMAFYITITGNLVLALGLVLVYLGFRRKILRSLSKRSPVASGAVAAARQATRISDNCLHRTATTQFDEAAAQQQQTQFDFEDDINLQSTPSSVLSAASSYIHLDHEELIIDRKLLEEESLDLSDRNPSTCGDSKTDLELSGYIHIADTV